MATSDKFQSSLKGYVFATHFGPTVLVVTISYVLSLTQYSAVNSLGIAAAILAGQCVVGWSNDLIDFPRDQAASRTNKPLVAGLISPTQLKRAIAVALILAAALSFLGPLGPKGAALHGLGLLSATLYNLKIKETLLSVLPYIISFGAVPWAIYASAGKQPSLWLVLSFIIFSSAFHFLNVVKDLETDIQQGVLGLPQRLGRKKSLGMAAFLALAGFMLVGLKWQLLF